MEYASENVRTNTKTSDPLDQLSLLETSFEIVWLAHRISFH